MAENFDLTHGTRGAVPKTQNPVGTEKPKSPVKESSVKGFSKYCVTLNLWQSLVLPFAPEGLFPFLLHSMWEEKERSFDFVSVKEGRVFSRVSSECFF
ncbi:hypothetical protein SUGI_0989130 [Cryptomeria japonica]|nr:hypothetical protein SUGI_0989130 [Cryptomeria japonica]